MFSKAVGKPHPVRRIRRQPLSILFQATPTVFMHLTPGLIRSVLGQG